MDENLFVRSSISNLRAYKYSGLVRFFSSSSALLLGVVNPSSSNFCRIELLNTFLCGIVLDVTELLLGAVLAFLLEEPPLYKLCIQNV